MKIRTVHLRHPQATEDDLVESRVGPAGQEAVKLVPVLNRQQRIPTVFRTKGFANKRSL